MSIVFITIPGADKEAFAHELQTATNGAVAQVIVQKSAKAPLVQRTQQFFKRTGWMFWYELWYGLLLRLSPQVRHALQYFTYFAPVAGVKELPATMHVRSVNSDEVYERLKSISPDLLVVWGSTILEPRIHTTAKQSINLHFGLCPHYRGALGNQHAVMDSEYDKIGATIHYINGKPDAGAVLATCQPDLTLPPKQLFAGLKRSAMDSLLDISVRLHRGEAVPATAQDLSVGKTFFLKDWLPSVRFALGVKMLRWQEETTNNQIAKVASVEEPQSTATTS